MTLDEAKEQLKEFESDPTLKTVGRYSPSAGEYPNNEMPFHKIHENYLEKNKNTVNPRNYLSNLKLMITIRKK